MTWGPQPDWHAALPATAPRPPGTWLLVLPIVAGAVGLVFGGFLLVVVAILAANHPDDLVGVGIAAAVIAMLVLLVSAGIGFGGARAGTGWFYRRAGIAIC